MADMISNLPDEVLCHILSFLPTEDVVATMILSKRWRPLWPLVSTLDFDKDRYLDGKESRSESDFISFVYAAIVSRGLNQSIKTFKFSCPGCPYRDIQVWLNAVKKCQLESLEIWDSDSRVSWCYLSCKTLVTLKLHDVTILPFSSVDLPSLKTLLMDEVEFVNPQFLMDLLYGCPVLQDLEIHDVYFDFPELDEDDIDFNDTPFEGKVTSLSNLVRAKVDFDHVFHIPVKAYSNAQFLHLNKCDADIPVFHNLTYLELSFRHSHLKWNLALDMLNQCPKLQTAVFDLTDYHEDDVWPDPGFGPESFSSHLRKCFIIGYRGKDCQMRFVRYVLQNSTSLRAMTISTRGYRPDHPRRLKMITELASYPRSSAVCTYI